MAGTELQQGNELFVGDGSREVHPRGVVRPFDLSQKLILPLPLLTGRAVTHTGGLPHNHDLGVWELLLQRRQRPQEGVATAVRLQSPVHESDDLLIPAQNGAVRELKRCGGGVGTGPLSVDAIVNHADFFLPLLRETAGLEMRWRNIPIRLVKS